MKFHIQAFAISLVLAVSFSGYSLDAAESTTKQESLGGQWLRTGTLSWTTTPPLPLPVSTADGSVHIAYKNPSVVQANGSWYIIASRKSHVNGKVRHSLAYFQFADWSKSAAARMVPLFADESYTSAPCVFHLTTQRTWYVICDWKDQATGQAGPAYSTMTDIDQPASMSKPKMLFPTVPASLPKKNGVRWLDPTAIRDGSRMFLFFTDDSGHFLRSSTSLDDFPHGWDDPVVVMTMPTTVLFEASCTYRITGSTQFLTLIEAIDTVTKGRFYNAFLADRLDGDWRLVTAGPERPFAGPTNVTAPDGTPGWSRHISHGELLRTTNDEWMLIDPDHLRFLYQGWDAESRVPGIPLGPFNGYHEIPYQLSLLEAKP